MSTTTIMRVNGYPVSVDKDGYICLTDIAKSHNKDARPADTIKNWLSTKGAIDFLGTWEAASNVEKFKVVGFHHLRNKFNEKAFCAWAYYIYFLNTMNPPLQIRT